jgi:hypothetical protein
MPKHILDTLVSVGGISGEYEALTETEIATAPGAAYSPPEEFDNFRVVASRVVQLLGGSPVHFRTFQTTACTLRVPFGALATNDAQDGRYYIIKNDITATGLVTIETSGVGTAGITTLAELLPGDTATVVHGDNDDWTASVDSVAAGNRRFPDSTTDPTTPTPTEGDRYYNTTLEMEMQFDGSRSKFLSVESVIFLFGGRGNVGAGAFFIGLDNLSLGTASGWTAKFNGTITGLGFTRTNTATATIEIVEGGTTRATLATGTATSGSSAALDGDFTQGGILAARNQTGGNNITDSQNWFQVKWRA